MTGKSQKVTIFSTSATAAENQLPFISYDNTIFTGNSSEIAEIHYSSSSAPPLVRQHCLAYCLTTQSCDAVFIAYKSGSSELDWCKFYRIGLTVVSFVTLEAGIPQLLLEPWNTLWPGGNGIPASSELMVIGKRTYFFQLQCYIVQRKIRKIKDVEPLYRDMLRGHAISA